MATGSARHFLEMLFRGRLGVLIRLTQDSWLHNLISARQASVLAVLGHDGLALGRFFPLNLKVIADINSFELNLLGVSLLHLSCITVAPRFRLRAQVLLRRTLQGPFADTAHLFARL